MNSSILVFYPKVLTGRINYNERSYKRDSTLASEKRVTLNRLQTSLARIKTAASLKAASTLADN